ncbi:hypothetical protein ENBRE01_0793 [Enteropsectra breve]|nr:hypothetical protein ENBRE01_0793 [Enteropsectra breve]
MEWPSRSPDLNPVENLFGLLARRVYEGNRQFENNTLLKTAIISSWSTIEKEVTDALIASMPKRMLEVLKNHGSSIKY